MHSKPNIGHKFEKKYIICPNSFSVPKNQKQPKFDTTNQVIGTKSLRHKFGLIKFKHKCEKEEKLKMPKNQSTKLQSQIRG